MDVDDGNESEEYNPESDNSEGPEVALAKHQELSAQLSVAESVDLSERVQSRPLFLYSTTQIAPRNFAPPTHSYENLLYPFSSLFWDMAKLADSFVVVGTIEM